MHNINAFFKLRAKELNYSNKDIAEQLSLSTSYVSQIFNGKKTIQKERILKKFIQFFKCNFDVNVPFENKINQYMHALYFMDETRPKKFQDVQSHKNQLQNTPYYIDLLLNDFINLIMYRNFNKEYESILAKLLYIADCLEINYQKTFYTFYFLALQRQFIQSKAELVFEKANTLPSDDLNLEMMLNYFGFAFPWSKKPLE